MYATISLSVIKIGWKTKKNINSQFFCSEFQSVSRIMKIVHSELHIYIPIIQNVFSIPLQYGKVLIYTDLSLIFVFMSAYTISTIMLSFFLSTLFNRANIAAAAGGIIFFCVYLPYSFMVVWESKITHSIRIASVSHKNYVVVPSITYK